MSSKLFSRLFDLAIEEVAPGARDVAREVATLVDAIVYERAVIVAPVPAQAGRDEGDGGDTIVAEVLDARGEVVGVTTVTVKAKE